MAASITPDRLEQDCLMLRQLIDERRLVSTETMPDDLQFLWRTYLVILESALSTADTLVTHLRMEN